MTHRTLETEAVRMKRTLDREMVERQMYNGLAKSPRGDNERDLRLNQITEQDARAIEVIAHFRVPSERPRRGTRGRLWRSLVRLIVDH